MRDRKSEPEGVREGESIETTTIKHLTFGFLIAVANFSRNELPSAKCPNRELHKTCHKPKAVLCWAGWVSALRLHTRSQTSSIARLGGSGWHELSTL